MGEASLQTLAKMEEAELNESNKPKEAITLESAIITELPFVTFSPRPMVRRKTL